MEAYLPSEVARLVLGYLEEVKCTNTWETFLVESPHLQEYYQLHQQGIKYAANINGKSLLGILQEYRTLIGGSSKQSGTQCSSNKTSNPLNSENYTTPNKNNRNKFTKFQVNQKIQTQSVVTSLKYGQSNVSSSRRPFNVSETPHHVNICKTPKRQVGVHVTALNFGPEAHTVRINDARNCKSTTDKANFHLQGNNLQTSVRYSVPTVSGSCVSEPDLHICHRTVQTEPLSNSLIDLNAGNHNLQREQPSASDTLELNNSENVPDRLPAQSDVANTGSSICNITESSPTCSATESCEELGGSSSEPAVPFLKEQLNLESSTKIVSTEDQISIVKQSLVCASSEVTTCSENVVVTATVENSVTPQYVAEPPTYNRAPSTNSPRLILSYDRSQIASLTTPMKDKRYVEEFYSPKRKGFIPRRRLLSESPLPKQVQGNDRTSLAIHEDWPFLDFSCTDTLAQIIAENINKVKSSEEVVKDSDGSNSSTYPSLQDINGSEDVIKNVLARTEADPVVDDFLSFLCNSRDSYEVNLTQESAMNSTQSNTFKDDGVVTKDNNCTPGSAEDKNSDKQAAVNSSSVETAVNYMSSITNEESDKLSELSSSAEKSTLPDNNSFTNLPSTQNNAESVENTVVSVQNTNAKNCTENTDELPNNIIDSAVDSTHDDNDDNDSVVELAVFLPQKQDISKSINAVAKISSAPDLSTKEVNTQTGASNFQSADITDSCNNMLNEHKSKSLCPQCHSDELVTNIVTVNTADNESLQVLQESCPNCHFQQLGKNNENNSSTQMSLLSNKQIINTEDRTQTTVPVDSNDIHLYGNHADGNKSVIDNSHDKQMVTGMNINQMFSNSVTSSVVENASSQAAVYDKAVSNNVANIGNTSNTFQEISTSVPSVQTVTLGVPRQNVNNSVSAPTLLQWPYSTVPTIFVSNNLPNVLPNPNVCQYQIIFKPNLNQSSGNASNVILPLQPVSSVNQVPNTYLPLSKDVGASNAAISSVNENKPEYRTVKKLVFIPSSTNAPETNKRKQEAEDEPASKKIAFDVQEKKSKPVKQRRTKRKKSKSLFPSDSPNPSNKNRDQRSKITEIGDEIPVISIPEPSPSKSDLRSAFEIFSEITEITEKQSPVLQTLISSAKLLSGEGGRLNATHVRALDFSPKKNKEKGGSQIKPHWQKKFNEEFPNRRASSRIKKLHGMSVESKNLDIVDDNRHFAKDASEEGENTARGDAINDNCSTSGQHVTDKIINKTIQNVCTNKPVSSEMANVVLKAMEEAITLKSLNNTVSEMPSIGDISNKVQTSSVCASMPEVIIDAEDDIGNKFSHVLTNASKSPVASKNENAVRNMSSKSVTSVECGLSAKNKKCSNNNSDLAANLPVGEEVLKNKKASDHNANLTANPSVEKEPENSTILLNVPSDKKLLLRHEYFPESDNSSSSSDLPDIFEHFSLRPNQNDSLIKSPISKSIPVQGQTEDFISVSKKEHFASNPQKSEKCPSILKTPETSRKGKRNAVISPKEKSNDLRKDDKLKKNTGSGQVLTDEERLLRYTVRDNKHRSDISKFSSLKDKHLNDKNMNTLPERVGEVIEQTFSKSPVSEAANMQPELAHTKHKTSISVNKNKKISNKLPYQKNDQTFSYSNANVNPTDIGINEKANLSLGKEKNKTSDATATKCRKKLEKKLTGSGTNNKHSDKPYQGEKRASSDTTSSKCLKKLEKDVTANEVDNKLHHSDKEAISDVTSSKYLKKQENDLIASDVNDSDKPYHSEKQAISPRLCGKKSFEINDSNSAMSCKGSNVNMSCNKSTNNSSEVPSSVKEHTKLTSDSVTLQPVFESVFNHSKAVDCPEDCNMETVSEYHQREDEERLSQSLTDEKSQKSKNLNTEFNGNQPVCSKYLNLKGDDTATKVLSNQVPSDPKISKAADFSNSSYNQSVSKNSDNLNEISVSVSNNQNSPKLVDFGLSEVSKSSEISDFSKNMNSNPQHDKIIDKNSEIMNFQVQTSKVGHMKSPKNLNLENTITSAQSSDISPPQTNIIPPLKKRIKPVQIGSPSHRSCLPGSPFMPEEHTVCVNSPSNLTLRKDACLNAGISICDAVNAHTLSENADFKSKNFTPPKQKFCFQKPLSGKPRAMTEFYRNAIPERSSSVPISPESMSSSSCTLDTFLAKRQLELLSSSLTAVNANGSQAKVIENVLNSENFNGKQKPVDSLNTNSTFSSLSDTFTSPNKTDADTLLTPPQRRKRKRPVKMLSSPEPTPEKLPLKPETQEAEHLVENSFVNIKSLHSSPVKCTSIARNPTAKSIFHKKMEQNPNMPAGVKMPPKWNISKISSYTNDIFNSNSSNNEKKKNEKEFKTDRKMRKSRPSLKVKSAFKAQSAMKQKCASEKNVTKSKILCDKSIVDSGKNSEKLNMQEYKKKRVSCTNSNSSNKRKISGKIQSRKSDSPIHNKSPKKNKVLNNTEKGKLATATKTSKIEDVFVYKEIDSSFQNSNLKTYHKKECQSVSKNVCAGQVNQYAADPEKMQVKSVSESADELPIQTYEPPTERSSEDENELAQAIAFITSNREDNESMLIDDPDKDLENRLDTSIQEPSSVSSREQKSHYDDGPEPEENVEAEKRNDNSLRNVETEEMAICTEQSESVKSAVTEETAVHAKQAESVNSAGAEETAVHAKQAESVNSAGAEETAVYAKEAQSVNDAGTEKTAVYTEEAKSVKSAGTGETLDEQAKIEYLMNIIKEYGVENVLSILRRRP